MVCQAHHKLSALLDMMDLFSSHHHTMCPHLHIFNFLATSGLAYLASCFCTKTYSFLHVYSRETIFRTYLLSILSLLPDSIFNIIRRQMMRGLDFMHRRIHMWWAMNCQSCKRIKF